MPTSTRVTLVTALIVAVWSSPGRAALPVCATSITACCEIKTSGSYALANDLNQTTANLDCIDIKAKDVDLDTLGFNLTGPGSGTGVGILIEGSAKNVSVAFPGAGPSFGSASTVSAFSIGVEDDAEGADIEGGTISGNLAQGVVLKNVKNSVVDAVQADGNVTNGIEVDKGSNDYVTGSDGSSNGQNGLVLSSTKNVVVTSSDFTSNAAGDAVLISGGSNNVFDDSDGDASLNGVVIANSKDNVVGESGEEENTNYGIWISGSTGNVVAESSVENNGGAALYIGCAATGGPTGAACSPKVKASTGNVIVSSNFGNFARSQPYGIAVDLGDTPNTITTNLATGNLIDDAFDANTGCGGDRWNNNGFSVASQSCIH